MMWDVIVTKSHKDTLKNPEFTKIEAYMRTKDKALESISIIDKEKIQLNRSLISLRKQYKKEIVQQELR